MENTQNEVNLKKGVNNSNNMATNQASLDDKLLEAYVGKKYQIPPPRQEFLTYCGKLL